MALLEVDAITGGYGEADILHDVTMRVEDGEVVAAEDKRHVGKMVHGVEPNTKAARGCRVLGLVALGEVGQVLKILLTKHGVVENVHCWTLPGCHVVTEE